jgi:16S rRNA G966 N2-methylase RsmD
MHSYWSKKPYSVTAGYINHFTRENDIVLDPFCGCGVTNVEALRARRKTIGVDINPLATFITRGLSKPTSLVAMQKAFREIREKVEEQINSLYYIECPKCGSNAIATYFVWDGQRPSEALYKCPYCRTKGKTKKISVERILKVEREVIPFWYPKTEMVWNTRINIHRNTSVNKLFTKRNLMALAVLNNAIEALSETQTKEVMRFIFSSCLRLCSKSAQRRAESASVAQVPNFWVPEHNRLEKNVWVVFDAKYRNAIKGKNECNETIGAFYREAQSLEDIEKDKTILLLTQSATNLSKIPKETVDYVITDPPYYDEVPYLELSLLWTSWLKLDVTKQSLENEIVVSDSPSRKKDFENYKILLERAFTEVFRVLKPGSWISVWFHNRKLKVWNVLINILRKIGFEMVNMVYQPHSLITFKQARSPSGTLRGHFVLNFRKPISAEKPLDVAGVDIERIMIQTARRVLVERNGANLSEIYQELIPVLVRYGALDIMTKMQTDLAPFMDKNFKRSNDEWHVKEEDYGKLGDYIPLRARLKLFVPSIVIRLNKTQREFSFDDIYQNLLPLLTNGKTPEKQEIIAVLKDCAQETSSGKWEMRKPTGWQTTLEPVLKRLPSIPTEITHDNVIRILARLGEYAGCSIHIGENEQRKDLELAKLSTYDIRKLPLENEMVRIIEQIDVIWLKENMIVMAFEVEETTPVYSGLARFSDLVKSMPNVRIRAYIVAPEPKIEKVINEFNRATFKDLAREQKWGYISYKGLTRAYDAIRQDRLKIRPEAIEDLARNPFT